MNLCARTELVVSRVLQGINVGIYSLATLTVYGGCSRSNRHVLRRLSCKMRLQPRRVGRPRLPARRPAPLRTSCRRGSAEAVRLHRISTTCTILPLRCYAGCRFMLVDYI
jgi:hypothetical protein